MSDGFSKFFNEVYGEELKAETPYGSLQYKGSDICADLHCSCGFLGHVDGAFCYYYECSQCGKKYALGMNIKLIELTEEQAKYAATRHEFFIDKSEVSDEPT